MTAAQSSPWSSPSLLPLTRTSPTQINIRTRVGNFGELVDAHAALLAGSFVLLFPLGVLLLRLRSPRWHWALQLLATLLCIAGLGVAIAMSKGSVQYVDFTEGHQILGILVVALVVLQFALGWVHHVQYKRTGARSWLTRGHLGLGRLVVGLGMVNGIL